MRRSENPKADFTAPQRSATRVSQTFRGHVVWNGFFVLVILFSVACGYGVRELVSRRRRAAAREEYDKRHPKMLFGSPA
jgi:hypothetical protein